MRYKKNEVIFPGRYKVRKNVNIRIKFGEYI